MLQEENVSLRTKYKMLLLFFGAMVDFWFQREHISPVDVARSQSKIFNMHFVIIFPAQSVIW